jgi:hypothetical protein
MNPGGYRGYVGEDRPLFLTFGCKEPNRSALGHEEADVCSLARTSKGIDFAERPAQLSNQTSCAKICGGPVAVHPGFGVNATTFA